MAFDDNRWEYEYFYNEVTDYLLDNVDDILILEGIAKIAEENGFLPDSEVLRKKAEKISKEQVKEFLNAI